MKKKREIILTVYAYGIVGGHGPGIKAIPKKFYTEEFRKQYCVWFEGQDHTNVFSTEIGVINKTTMTTSLRYLFDNIRYYFSNSYCPADVCIHIADRDYSIIHKIRIPIKSMSDLDNYDTLAGKMVDMIANSYKKFEVKQC